MRAYAVQMHLHGSCSEGSASCLAHDHEAAESGLVDLIWWTDHDFRVANFAKVPGYTFNALLEHATIPNRKPNPAEPTMLAAMTWQPVLLEGATPQREVDPEAGPKILALAESEAVRVSADVIRTGTGSLRLSLPAGDGTSERLYEFLAQTQYHRFPLLSHPLVKLAVRPAEGIGTGGEVLIRFILSEQPPDLAQPVLTYVIGGSDTTPSPSLSPSTTPHAATISLPWEPGTWTEHTIDLAADVERLGIAGGLDNSLHKLQIGLCRRSDAHSPALVPAAPVAAYFDSLEIAPRVKGTAVLDLHRVQLAQLPTRVKHLVGIEISYYGQHINAFGSRVPIPDYEGLLPSVPPPVPWTVA